MITITRIDDRIACTSPYNIDVIKELKRLGGRWDPNHRAWHLPWSAEPEVRNLFIRHYGTDGQAIADHIVVEIVCDDYSVRCDPLAWRGRPLIAARGRDSGARPCDGVSIISGSVGSGGSIANWTTTVEQGTVLRVCDVPRDWLDDAPEFADALREVPAQAPSSERLHEERERLIARVAEIDALLADHPGSD